MGGGGVYMSCLSVKHHRLLEGVLGAPGAPEAVAFSAQSGSGSRVPPGRRAPGRAFHAERRTRSLTLMAVSLTLPSLGEAGRGWLGR